MGRGGVIVPIATVFGPEEEVDRDRNRGFAEGLVAGGVDHVFTLGTLGEFPLLDPEERRVVIEAHLAAVRGDTDVWVQAGAPSTRRAVRSAREAEGLGASAVVAVPPYYVRPALSSILAYYRALHEACGLPLYAYNIPSRVGYALPPGLVHRLAREGALAGVKDTSGSIESVGRFLEGSPPGFEVFPGDDPLCLASARLGSTGAVLGLANIVPKLAVALQRACAAKAWARAEPLQRLLDRVAEVRARGPFPATDKFLAREFRGAPDGYRAPDDPLTGEEEAAVRAAWAPLERELAPWR